MVDDKRAKIVAALLQAKDSDEEWCPASLDSYEDAAEVIATIVLRALDE